MKSPRPHIAAGALLLAAATAAYSQAPEPGSTATNAGASLASNKPFVSFEGTDMTVRGLPAITFHGFASQGFIDTSSYNYLAADTKGGSFEFSEFGLNASASPFERTRIAAQAFMFDVGDVGN